MWQHSSLAPRGRKSVGGKPAGEHSGRFSTLSAGAVDRRPGERLAHAAFPIRLSFNRIRKYRSFRLDGHWEPEYRRAWFWPTRVTGWTGNSGKASHRSAYDPRWKCNPRSRFGNRAKSRCRPNSIPARDVPRSCFAATSIAVRFRSGEWHNRFRRMLGKVLCGVKAPGGFCVRALRRWGFVRRIGTIAEAEAVASLAFPP